MQRILWFICSCLLSVNTPLLSQQKYVIGSPVSTESIQYVNRNGEIHFIYPGGDNHFNYLLSEDNIPCIKIGDQYVYGLYQDGQLVTTHKEVGSELSDTEQNKYIRSFKKMQSELVGETASLKSTQLAPSVQSAGEINILLILVEFSNKKHTSSKKEINALFNEPGTAEQAGFKEFFSQASHDKLSINIDVVGWYNCNDMHTKFSESKGMYLTGNLVRKAVDAAEADGVDFSKYDNNKDGKADAIMVMHAGLGADHRGNEEYIWPHSWALSSTVNKAVTYDGVKIDEYVIACEQRAYNGVAQAAGIGTFAHEFGHALGLPDMYDGTGKSNGLGHWALMSAGSWLDGGYRPSNFCAWSRYNLGWEEPTIKNYDEISQISLSSMNSTVNQLVRINTKSDDQYFLFENRQNEKNDGAQPASGLAVYQVSKSKLALERGINDDRDYPGIRLLEADFNSSKGLYGAKDRGTAADLFSGSDDTRTIGVLSNPSTNLFGGGASGVEIENIVKASNNDFSFEITGPKPTLNWSSTVFQESPLNNGQIVNTIEVVLEGDEFLFDGDILSVNAYEFSNLPSGLSVVITKVSDVSINVSIQGIAQYHEKTNDVTNMKIVFNDAAFKTLASSNIQNSSVNTLRLKFYNEEEGVRLFVEDFEGLTPPNLPSGWEAPKGSKGNDSKWETVVGSNHTASGNNGMQFYDSNANDESFWLISPAIDLKDYADVVFSFWQKYDLNGDAKNKVAVSTDKTNWTIIYNSHPSKSDVWEEAIAKIPDNFQGETIYIGFCIYEAQAWGWFWDDVSLKVEDNTAVHTIKTDKEIQIKYDDVLQDISIESIKKVKAIEIYNMTGQCLFKVHNSKQASVQSLNKSVYIVVVRFSDGTTDVLKIKK